MRTTGSFLRRTVLVQREADLADTWKIIGWWEVRHVPYNLSVVSRKPAGWSLASDHTLGTVNHHQSSRPSSSPGRWATAPNPGTVGCGFLHRGEHRPSSGEVARQGLVVVVAPACSAAGRTRGRPRERQPDRPLSVRLPRRPTQTSSRPPHPPAPGAPRPDGPFPDTR